MRIADVRINLRGFRRVMSQQPLDVAQIGACLQQMRGKRMAQRDVKPVSRQMQSLIQIYRRFHKFIILFLMIIWNAPLSLFLSVSKSIYGSFRALIACDAIR